VFVAMPNAQEILDTLTEVANARPKSAAPNPRKYRPEVVRLHKALSSLIVNVPKDALVSDEFRQILRPLLEQFGHPSSPFNELTLYMFDRVIATAKNDPDWERILKSTGPANLRIGGGDNYQSHLRQRVKDFAGLILQSLATAELTDHGRTEDADAQVVMALELHLNVGTNGTALRPRLTGDLQRWYLGMLQPTERQQTMAKTIVILVPDPDDHTNELAPEGAGWDAINHRDWIEREIVSRYDASVEDVVRGICGVALKWFRRYYQDPDWVARAVSVVLESVWNPQLPQPGTSWLEATHSLNPSIRIRFPVPTDRLQQWAIEQRSRPDRLERYVEKVLRRLVWLDDDVLMALACPALLDRWLRPFGPLSTVHEDVFFDLTLWKLRLSPAQ